MKHVVTAAQMRAWEQTAMQRGVSGRVLMELASYAVTELVCTLCPPGGSVLVCCGGGNNGGDGLACARQLAMHGIKTHVLLLAQPDHLPADAQANYIAAAGFGVPVTILHADAAPALPSHDVIVDALLGTGLSRSVEGIYAALIEQINMERRPVVSIDIPSGIGSDTGAVLGCAVQATHTVTFQYPKLGHLFFPGRSYCGKLSIAPLTPPLTPPTDSAQWLDEQDIAQALPPRDANSHKGHYGRVLLIAGSGKMPGAAALAARAALRAGCGLLTVALPQNAQHALSGFCPEAMALPLPEHNGELSAQCIPALEEALKDKTCVAIGPGLGRSEAVVDIVMHILRHTAIPILADADALFALAQHPEALHSVHAPLILTPHAGEMSRLSGAPIADIAASPLIHAQTFAKAHGAVVHLKGATSVTAAPSGEIMLTTSGNAGLAKGGSGDVLTGIIAAMLAQGLAPYSAAGVGALLHGRAADKALENVGEMAMLASDVIEALGKISI